MSRSIGDAKGRNILSPGARLVRAERWAVVLRAELHRHRDRPFEWGVSDCATMFADAVLSMTGVDPIEEYRGYTSEAGALRMLAKSGAGSMVDYIARLFPEIPPSMAGRGDLVYAPDAMGPLMCPAVLDGAYAHSKNQTGPLMWSRAVISRAFAV